MAPKQQSRLDALRRKLQTAVDRWVRSKQRVNKCECNLKCAVQGRQNMEQEVKHARNNVFLEYPKEDISDLLSGESDGDGSSTE